MAHFAKMESNITRCGIIAGSDKKTWTSCIDMVTCEECLYGLAADGQKAKDSPDMFSDVLEFHKKFGCFIGQRPAIPDKGTVDLRWNLVDEEINKELKVAMETGNLPEIADAACDAIYVLLGLLISYGIDARPIWNQIQKSNMSKVGGKTRADGKIMKPEGWTHPDIANLLEQQTPRCAEPSEAKCRDCQQGTMP